MAVTLTLQIPQIAVEEPVGLGDGQIWDANPVEIPDQGGSPVSSVTG